MDVALLKGEKGARVRCRRCGGHIEVRAPEESPVPPAADVPGAFRSEPASSPVPPPQETSPLPAVEAAAPAQEPAAFEADISGVVRSELVPSPPEETAVPPDRERIEPEPEPPRPGTTYSRIEDLFASPTGKDAGPDRIPFPSKELPAGEYSAEETAATEPARKAPSRRAPRRVAVLLLPVILVLLLTAGALFFGTTKAGQARLGKFFPGWGSMGPGSVAENQTYDIREVKWSFDHQTASGSLFVIKGEVANFGKSPSVGIGLRATLLGKDNQALVEKMAFAGNPLTEAALRQMDRPGIEGAMSNRFGQGNVNKEIPPGKVLPFMVVFFDPPGEIVSVMVKAIDVR